MTETEKLARLSGTPQAQGNRIPKRHALTESWPQSGRVTTACGRTLYAWTGERSVFPVTCTACLKKDR